MSPPQLGMGRFWKWRYDLRRMSRIQSGSPFIQDISRMMSSFSPRLGLKTYSSASLQPSLYFPRSRSATAMRGGPFPVTGNFSYGDGNNSAVGSLPDGEPTVRLTVSAGEVDD